MIYIGRHKLNMENYIQHPMLYFNYEIIDLSSLQPEEFLASEIPGEVILAILAGRNMRGRRRSVVRKVLFKLRKLLEGIR